MSKPVEINVVWSKALALKGSKLYYDYDMRHSSKRYIGWFFVALTQFAIVGALKHHAFALLYLSTFLVVYWYYGRWFLRKRMIERFYDKNVSEERRITFLVNEEGIRSDDTNIDWESVVKVISFDDGILLQTLQNTLFFENAAFRSEKERARLMHFAKEKGKL